VDCWLSKPANRQTANRISAKIFRNRSNFVKSAVWGIQGTPLESRRARNLLSLPPAVWEKFGICRAIAGKLGRFNENCVHYVFRNPENLYQDVTWKDRSIWKILVPGWLISWKFLCEIGQVFPQPLYLAIKAIEFDPTALPPVAFMVCPLSSMDCPLSGYSRDTVGVRCVE